MCFRQNVQIQCSHAERQGDHMLPLTLVTTKTPDRLTPQILAACMRLVPDGQPQFVSREPVVDALINKCTFNVRRYLTEHSGTMVLGWEVCIWEDVLLDFIGHAVVLAGDRMHCVTPSTYPGQQLLFLPDPKLTFDFNDPIARMPAAQMALSSRADVKRLIELEAQERTIKVKFPVSSGQIMIEGNDAIALKRIGREKQTLMLKIVLATHDHTSRCPCGSGKKFRKCHRVAIEQMLRQA
jgi:hypothetical protein